MFDKDYNEPNYSPGTSYGPTGGYEPASQGLSYVPSIDIKKYLPLIIAAVIAIIVIVLILSWFGSQQQVTINLNSIDGVPVNGSLALRDKDNKPISGINPKGESESFTVTLWPGTYKATITADGYKNTYKTITIPSENPLIDTNMSKDLDATLTIPLIDSTSIYDGQTISGKISVQNNGASFSSTDIAATSNTYLDVSIVNPSNPTINNGNTFIDFNVKVKSTAKLTTETKATTISFRIKGTAIIISQDLQVFPTVPVTSVSVTGTLRNTSLTAGNKITSTITIRNNGKLSLTNVILAIEPTGGTDDKLSWFKFNQAQSGTPTTITIDSIDAGKSKDIILYAQPPANAQKDDEFTGVLRVSSLSMKGNLAPDMDFVVFTEKQTRLTLNGPVTSPITITCSGKPKVCLTKTWSEEVYFKNTGNTEITNITIEAPELANPATNPTCIQYLTQFITTNPTDSTKIDSIQPGDKATLLVTVTAPLEAVNNDTTTCVIKWKYLDPLDSSQVITDSTTMKITKSDSTA